MDLHGSNSQVNTDFENINMAIIYSQIKSNGYAPSNVFWQNSSPNPQKKTWQFET